MSNLTRHILVVDDNPSIHDDFRKIFGALITAEKSRLEQAASDLFGSAPAQPKTSYELDFASQGREALEMVRAALANRQPYSLAFIDVQMPPGWDGIQTMSEIWKIAPDLHIVICTAHSNYSFEEIQNVGRSGQVVVLKKPFDAIEVLQMANVFSEKWHLLNEVKERARKLEESQHRYRFLAEATPELLWTATAGGNVDYLNGRWKDYTGQTVETGQWSWQAAVHPEDLPSCIARWTGALQTGENFEGEYRLRRADGVYRWHLGRACPMRNDHGDILHWVGTCTDIDDKKRAETELIETNTTLERRVTDRTAELTKSETRYKELINGQAEGVVYTDIDFKFTFANPAAENILGVWPGQLLGKTLYEFLDEKNKAIVQQQLKLRKAGQKSNYEIEITTPRGEHRQLLITAAPRVDSTGNVCGAFAIFHNITQRKAAELALRDSQRLLRAMLDNIPDPAWLKDSQGRYLVGNKPLAHLYQRNLEDILGKTTSAIFPGAVATPMEDHGQSAPGKPVRSEICIRDDNGRPRWFDAIETPILNENGQLASTVGIARDITERKQMEQALRESENRLRSLADNVPDAVIRIDRNYRLAYGNRTFATDIHKQPSEFLGKTGEELNFPDHERWHEEFRQVFATGLPRTFEFNWTSPNGVGYRESRLVPEFSPTGEVEFVLVVTRDVTEQKVLERERQLMDFQLRQAQKMEAVGQLAAGIAHEINTPTQYVGDNTQFLKDAFQNLTAVLKGYTELIAAARLNAITPELIAHAEQVLVSSDLDYHIEQIPAAISETLEGIARVSKIVRAMKEFSHPGGREKSTADLNKAIDSTTTVCRNEWKYVADLVLDLDPTLPPVPCFLSEFNQAILNLVVNAAHAIGDAIKSNPGQKGTITVRTRRDGEFAEVRVSDTGSGIPEVHRHHIFEPFFTTKEVGKGTGQGLTVVYSSIVKKHGGTATFETEIGKGTTFILRLPLSSRTSATAPSDAAHGQRANTISQPTISA